MIWLFSLTYTIWLPNNVVIIYLLACVFRCSGEFWFREWIDTYTGVLCHCVLVPSILINNYIRKAFSEEKVLDVECHRKTTFDYSWLITTVSNDPKVCRE